MIRVPDLQDWGMDANQSARGTNPTDESANLLVTIFLQNYMKMKIIGVKRKLVRLVTPWIHQCIGRSQ